MIELMKTPGGNFVDAYGLDAYGPDYLIRYPHAARLVTKSSDVSHVAKPLIEQAIAAKIAAKVVAKVTEPAAAAATNSTARHSASPALASLSLEQLQKANALEDERAMKREVKAQVAAYSKAYHPNDNKPATLTPRQNYLLGLTPLGRQALKQDNK